MTRPDIPVTISGDPKGFESALSRVRNAARSTSGDVMASFGRLKNLGMGAVGLAGALGITTFIQAAKSAADAVANIGDEAKRAGLSAKAFQEWKYIAEQARIPVDAITDGLKELQLRADEFAVTGKGSAAEAFQRLGLTPAEVKEKLKNPTELMLLLIERTRQLKDTAAGIRIFDELLGGTGGERMVALIEQGEAGIRSQIKAANDFGHVLSDDVIAKAQEIDRQFNTISMTVGNTLKSAVVSVVASLMDFMDGLRKVENQRNSTIQSNINDIMRQKQETAQAIAAIDGADSKLNGRQRAKAKGTHDIKMRQLDEEENRLIKELESRPSVMDFAPKASGTWTPPVYTPPPDTSGGKKSGSGKSKPNDYEREIQLIRKRTEALKSETAAQASINPLVNDYGYAVEFAAAKQELLTAAQDAGVKVTPQLTTSIEDLAAGYANAVVASELLAENQDKIRERAEEAMAAAKDLTRGAIDGFLEGADAADVLADSLKKIGSVLLDDVLNSIFKINNASSGGGGFLSSIFGGLFGGGKTAFPSAPGGLYSDGGYTGPGGKYQPAGVVHKGEYVMDADAVLRAGGPSAMDAIRRGIKGYASGGFVGSTAPALPSLPSVQGSSGGIVVNFNPVIDNRGASVEAIARNEKALMKLQAELPGRVEAAVRSANKRNVKF